MPQIANQDYNVIDFDVVPTYEGVERLYRAYLQDTALDCVIKLGKNVVEKIIGYEETESEGKVSLSFFTKTGFIDYALKSPLGTDSDGYLLFKQKNPIYIVSPDGFKLKPTVKDGVLTGVEVTTEKVLKTLRAQYFKEWMIGQPVEVNSNH